MYSASRTRLRWLPATSAADASARPKLTTPFSRCSGRRELTRGVHTTRDHHHVHWGAFFFDAVTEAPCSISWAALWAFGILELVRY